MKAITMKVRDYFLGKSDLLRLDSAQLERAVDSLSEKEKEILANGMDDSDPMYDFVLHKVFYRHNDFVAGCSDLDDEGKMICSARSCITELDISVETYQACYEAGYVHIEDIDKEDFDGFSFEMIADLTAAIIRFECDHQIMLED